MERKRIIIVDDHQFVRELIKDYLTNYLFFEVIGEATNGYEALEKIAIFKPEVVLMDISYPEMSGLEVTKAIQEISKDIKTLILISDDEKAFLTQFIKNGVKGFIFKDHLINEIGEAIKIVLGDNIYISNNFSKVSLDIYIDSMKNVEKNLALAS
jgi:two-component system, NarL family, response regulator NreC